MLPRESAMAAAGTPFAKWAAEGCVTMKCYDKTEWEYCFACGHWATIGHVAKQSHVTKVAAWSHEIKGWERHNK